MVGLSGKIKMVRPWMRYIGNNCIIGYKCNIIIGNSYGLYGEN